MPRTPDSRGSKSIDELRPAPLPDWHVGDRVRFAHGPGPFTVSAIIAGGLVELKELTGQFAAQLFVGVDTQRFD